MREKQKYPKGLFETYGPRLEIQGFCHDKKWWIANDFKIEQILYKQAKE